MYFLPARIFRSSDAPPAAPETLIVSSFIIAFLKCAELLIISLKSERCAKNYNYKTTPEYSTPSLSVPTEPIRASPTIFL